MKIVTAISKKELLSDTMLKAMGIAEYRLRKNARYRGWDDDRRQRYMLERGLKAVIAVRLK